MDWYCISAVCAPMFASTLSAILHTFQCVWFFCFECTFGDFTGCLPVCGQLLPVCCLSFLRIFVAKDKILACKMFEIKSDRWHGILFCCRDFSNSFLFIIQLHKSFILWELFVFLQNLIIFHPNFSFIGSDFYL